MTGGGSARSVDALFARGDGRPIRACLDAFHAAGADQVALMVIGDHALSGLQPAGAACRDTALSHRRAGSGTPVRH